MKSLNNTCNEGSMAQVVAYAMMVPAPPFAVVCIAFLINGWGISLQVGVHLRVYMFLDDPIAFYDRMPNLMATLRVYRRIPLRKWELCMHCTVSRIYDTRATEYVHSNYRFGTWQVSVQCVLHSQQRSSRCCPRSGTIILSYPWV